jgi:hypothetical protein
MQDPTKTPAKPEATDEQKRYEATTSSDAAIETAVHRLAARQIIRNASEYVKKHISRQPPVQRFFSFMPTMLTRVSPFHFKGKMKSAEWPLVRLDSGDADSWGRMRVVINPYFLEMYAASFVTNIDLKFRSSLKSDVSKAFYRYYQGQYERDSSLDIMRLARAVNLENDLEMHRLKDKVRAGLKELHDRGYLEHYQISRDDRVITEKSNDSAAHYQSQILDPSKLPLYSD